jgi:peptide/nickel transport system permease protein
MYTKVADRQESNHELTAAARSDVKPWVEGCGSRTPNRLESPTGIRPVLGYILRRLVLAGLVFVVVSFVAFVFLAAPLDPTWKFGAGYHPERERLKEQFHLNEPAAEQYWLWVKGTITGSPEATRTVCGGRTLTTCDHLEVWPRVWPALGHTALLAGLSVLVVVVSSLLIGTIAARWPGSVLDVVLRTGSYLTWAIPAFVLAVLLQLLLRHLALSYDFEPFPVSGLPLPGEAGTGFHFIRVWVQHLALPVLTISVGFIGYYSRYVRSAMLVSLSEPYAVTARAKGLPERRVIARHALRNSLIPFVSLLTLDFGAVFGATLVADYVFAQQGLAGALAAAVYNADPFEVQPLVLVGAASVFVFSLLGDLVSSWLDPRIRLAD